MTTPPQIDIVTVAIAVAAALFGHDLATVIGPYSVIFLGALLGAAWSASRLQPRPRASTLAYMALIMLMALLITVPAAEWLAGYSGVQSQVLLAPVAAVITGIGPDWPGVLRWALSLVRFVIERWVSERPPSDPPPGGQS